jgi:hypothetical protein
MYVALLFIALGGQPGGPLVMPVGDSVPAINVEKTCKETTEADKAANIAVAQPFQRCISDENSAKQQLAAVWSTYPAPLRVRCEQEATLVGIGSYVDLLTCLQMTDGAKPMPTINLKGASKNRNGN